MIFLIVHAHTNTFMAIRMTFSIPVRPQKNVLITGLPGVGKTTAVISLANALKDLHPAGFYTSEIREGGLRQGFELIGLDGRKSILSHVNIHSPHRVSRYGVDIKGFDAFLNTLKFGNRETGLIIIDEIGTMECYSRAAGSLPSSGNETMSTLLK